MTISINRISDEKFEVNIELIESTSHLVFLSDETHLKIANKTINKEDLINFSIEFLLKREPNTSILSSFDLKQISTYFPEFFEEVKSWINE
mgnify:CR=1 FL=1